MSEYFDNTHLKSSFADLSIPKLLVLNAVAVVVKVDGEVIMMVTILELLLTYLSQDI
jgi:hypothetical protein